MPPAEQAVRYYYMGGSDEVVRKAEDSFANGDYRWVVEVLNHVVMADPEHIEGSALLADTFEQLGYQSESAPCGIFILRCPRAARRPTRIQSLYCQRRRCRRHAHREFFPSTAVRLLPEAALDVDLRIELVFTDLASRYLLSVRNSVLNYFKTQNTRSLRSP